MARSPSATDSSYYTWRLTAVPTRPVPLYRPTVALCYVVCVMTVIAAI